MVKLKRIDCKAEQDGKEFSHPDGWSVWLRSGNSPAVQEAIQKAVAEQVGESGRTGSLTSVELRSIMCRVYARNVLIGWHGIDDEPVFDPEAALRLMTQPDLRLFQDFVIESANRQDAYLQRGVEAIAKN